MSKKETLRVEMDRSAIQTSTLHISKTIVKRRTVSGNFALTKLISMAECNTILSAYTKYRHLG